MKKTYLQSFLIVFLMSCTTQEDTINQEENTIPTYMFEVFDENSNCSEIDFLNLKINEVEVSYRYTDSHLLCEFYEGNFNNSFCLNCDSHSARLTMPMQRYDTYFENLPIHTGMIWNFSEEEYVVNEINIKGLSIGISAPTRLVDELKTGKFRIPNDFTEKGIKLYFHWEIKTESYEFGYTLDMDKNQPYEIKINCIDRLNSNEVRLSGSFDGIFVGTNSFQNGGNNVIYQTPISGAFSYRITL